LRFAPDRGALSRLGPAALTALVHVLLAMTLLRHPGMQERDVDNTQQQYLDFAFIPAAKTPAPPTAIAPPVLARPTRLRPVAPVRQETEAAPLLVSEPMMAESTEVAAPQPATAQPKRFDMDSLRAAARQVESERLPTPLERQRESEQMRGADDSELARAVRRAKRPDCQTKYAEGRTTVNLLLLIPLAIETITDKGCKW
jgi:hypothetical protein